jgi:hypothetical protein
MAATDDVVPQVEVGIQGTRPRCVPRCVPTAWERTWAGMTRRTEAVGVDWLWRGGHLDLETGSLLSPRTDPPERAYWRRRYPTMHKRSKRHRQQQVTAVQEFQIGDQGRQQDDRYARSAGPSAKAAAAGGRLLA